jgi:hypothetical protein
MELTRGGSFSSDATASQSDGHPLAMPRKTSAPTPPTPAAAPGRLRKRAEFAARTIYSKRDRPAVRSTSPPPTIGSPREGTVSSRFRWTLVRLVHSGSGPFLLERVRSERELTPPRATVRLRFASRRSSHAGTMDLPSAEEPDVGE